MKSFLGGSSSFLDVSTKGVGGGGGGGVEGTVGAREGEGLNVDF